jgi:DNA invertase Pin-like site-specific DNA recombinase
MKNVAIYLRVSTTDQTTDNQRRELEAVAERLGWRVVRFFEGPGLSELLKAVARREVDLVVDRLGRSRTDLLEVLGELHARGVDLYLHQQGLDTSTPSGKAMFQMLGVFAEFERSMIRERVLAGMSRAAATAPRAARRSVGLGSGLRLRPISARPCERAAWACARSRCSSAWRPERFSASPEGLLRRSRLSCRGG